MVPVTENESQTHNATEEDRVLARASAHTELPGVIRLHRAGELDPLLEQVAAVVDARRDRFVAPTTPLRTGTHDVLADRLAAGEDDPDTLEPPLRAAGRQLAAAGAVQRRLSAFADPVQELFRHGMAVERLSSDLPGILASARLLATLPDDKQLFEVVVPVVYDEPTSRMHPVDESGTLRGSGIAVGAANEQLALWALEVARRALSL